MSPAGTIQIRVRYSECDPMGVAHHAAYPIWFEMGRTELLRASGRSYRDLEDAGVYLAVVSLEVKYRKAVRYDDLLTLHTTLRSTGHVKIDHEYRLTRGEQLVATARTVLACLDGRGKARQLPESLLVQ